MDTSMEDDIELDDGRISAESDEGFSFASTMDLRKNLSETFDKQVKTSAKLSSSTQGSGLSINDRIARFQQAVSKSTRPPLPNKQEPNAIPENNLSVYLRIRPPVAKEKNSSASAERNTIEIFKPKYPSTHPTTVRTYPPPQSNASRVHRDDTANCVKEYGFHQVMAPGTTQKTTYETVAAPLVQSLFRATTATNREKPKALTSESALLFAYGITNAGKTHTMLGNIKSNNDAKWGVIPRAISDLFDQMKQIKTSNYDLYLSYFEVYNEQIYDLIPKKSTSKHIGPPPPLQVRERQGRTIVKGLARHRVRDINHGIELTLQANAKRQTSSNNLNADSSRSHCVCQLQLVPRPANTAAKPSDDDSVVSMNGYSTDEEVAFLSKQKESTLWIVDLAGSERSKRTGLSSARQKEASQINMSLMTLMRCLSAMRENQKHSSSNVIPFRESKLTHLFMTHLTGPSASRTSMIVNVNPAVADFDETQHVLGYASQATTIRLDAEELIMKRKEYFGDEYGMDGRKKVKLVTKSAAAATKRFASKVAKKFSPKKIASKLSSKKMARPKVEKRKTEIKVSDAASQEAVEPKLKKMRYPPAAASKSTSNPYNKQQDIQALKAALAVAKADADMLKSENTDLEEELNQQESQVRMEVAEEMEEQMRATQAEYTEIVERLRSQIHSNTAVGGRSTRKAQVDKAEQHIEELMDKVEECEEEMIRMRKEHAQEIEQLKAQLEVNDISHAPSDSDSQTIRRLEQELEESKEKLEKFEKSKTELIENYEKLLQEDGEEEPTLENAPPAWRFRNNESENNSTQLSAKNRNSKPGNADYRRPLGSVSANRPDSPTDSAWERNGKRQRWLFPKKPSSRDDESAVYRRPSGRAPIGREWDGSVGAWRLDA
jgi:hypothetical protein